MFAWCFTVRVRTKCKSFPHEKSKDVSTQVGGKKGKKESFYNEYLLIIFKVNKIYFVKNINYILIKSFFYFLVLSTTLCTETERVLHLKLFFKKKER